MSGKPLLQCLRPSRPPPDARQMIEEVIANHPRDIVQLTGSDNLGHCDLERFLKGLTTNTHVKRLVLKDLGLDSDLGFSLVETLKENRALKILDLDNNRFSSIVILEILRAVQYQQSVTIIKFGNQSNRGWSTEAQMEVAAVVELNPVLRCLDLELTHEPSNTRVQNHLRQNIRRFDRQETSVDPFFDDGPLNQPKGEKQDENENVHVVGQLCSKFEHIPFEECSTDAKKSADTECPKEQEHCEHGTNLGDEVQDEVAKFPEMSSRTDKKTIERENIENNEFTLGAGSRQTPDVKEDRSKRTTIKLDQDNHPEDQRRPRTECSGMEEEHENDPNVFEKEDAEQRSIAEDQDKDDSCPTDGKHGDEDEARLGN